MAQKLPLPVRKYIEQERYNNTHSVHIVIDTLKEWARLLEINYGSCGYRCDTGRPCTPCQVKAELEEIINEFENV